MLIHLTIYRCSCFLAQYLSKDFSKLLDLKKQIKFTQLEKINSQTIRICTPDISILTLYFDKIEPDRTYTLAYNNTNTYTDHFRLMYNYTNTIFNNYLLDWPMISTVTKLIYRYGNEESFKSAGKLQTVYVLDKTVEESDELAGRLEVMIKDQKVCPNNSLPIVAGKRFGFAKNVKVRLINAVDCDGRIELSKLIRSLDLIQPDPNKVSLLLLNIVGLKSEILDSYLQSLYLKNVFIIAPAGNHLDDSCRYSPASFINSLTVGSVDSLGYKDKTNYGSCISVYTVNCASNLAGTGVSAAIVTGILVLYVDRYPNSNIEQLRKYFLKSTKESYGMYLVRYPKNENWFDEEWKLGLVIIVIVVVFVMIGYLLLRKKKEKLIEDVSSDSSL